MAEAAGGNARHEVEVGLVRETSTQQVCVGGGFATREAGNTRVSGEGLDWEKDLLETQALVCTPAKLRNSVHVPQPPALALPVESVNVAPFPLTMVMGYRP